MKTFLIFGDEYVYRGVFEHIGNGKREFKILERFHSNSYFIEDTVKSIIDLKETVLTVSRESDSNRMFGAKVQFSRHISGINYKCIKPNTTSVRPSKIVDVIDFQGFSVDFSLAKYYQFLGELKGILETETNSINVFSPGVKTHVLYTLKSKFKTPFDIYQITNIKSYSGMCLSQLVSDLDDNRTFVCGHSNNYYWQKLNEVKPYNLDSLIKPYNTIEITSKLIPGLQGMIEDSELFIDKESSEKLLGEISNFSYKSDMAYESLDPFPLMRSFLYIATERFKECESPIGISFSTIPVTDIYTDPYGRFTLYR